MTDQGSSRTVINEALPKSSNTRLIAIISASVGLCCCSCCAIVAFVLASGLLITLLLPFFEFLVAIVQVWVRGF